MSSNKQIRYNIDIKDLTQVKSFIYNKLVSSRLFKGKNFYIIIIKLYVIYPEFIKYFLDKLHEITSYKQYLYLLQYANNKNNTNQEFINYIYLLFAKKYKDDCKLLEEKKINSISLLAKWLPRHKKKFDIKCNFIFNFTKLVYPNLDRQVAHKVYRKTVSELCKKLNITESKIDNLKDYDYMKLNYHSFLTNYNILWKNSEKMIDYITKRNSKLKYFINRFLMIYNNSKKYEKEINTLEKLWLQKYPDFLNKYSKKLPWDSIITIDMSSRLFDTMKAQLISIYLLSLYKNDKIIINHKKPIILTKKNTLVENINNLINNINNTKILNLEEINKIANNSLIITDKKVNYPNLLYLVNTKINNNIGNPFYYKNNKYIEKIEKINEILDKLKTPIKYNFKYLIFSLFTIIILIAFFQTFFYFLNVF
jgi:hypothetical protein